MQPISYCSICYSIFPKDTKFLEKKIHRSDVILQPQDSTPVVLKCHHLFHTHCLHKWLAIFRDCKEKVCCNRCSTILEESNEDPAPSFSLSNLAHAKSVDDYLLDRVMKCKQQLLSDLVALDQSWDIMITLWGTLDEQLQKSVHTYKTLAGNLSINDHSLATITQFEIGPWRDGINYMKLKGFSAKESIEFYRELAEGIKTIDVSCLKTVQTCQRHVIAYLSVYETIMKQNFIQAMIHVLDTTSSEIQQKPSHLQQNALEQELPNVIAILNHYLENVILWDFQKETKMLDSLTYAMQTM